MGAFGTTIPVTGLNNGFPGTVSRIGKRTITARQVLSTTPNAIPFGAPCVIVPNGSGGGDTMQSVADFIAGGGTFTNARFAGIAVREIKTQINFLSLETIGTGQSGSYAPGTMGEILEEGSCSAVIAVGTPVSQGNVYVRTALNGAIPLGLVGDLEAAADGSNTVLLTGVLFRTGFIDGNLVSEITILNRAAA